MPPDLTELPSGCAFHPRCPFRMDKCVAQVPELLSAGGSHLGACWVTQEGRELV